MLQNKNTNSIVKVCLTVRDRYDSTKICLDSLIQSGSSNIYVYDNRSSKDLNKLIPYYNSLIKTNKLCGLYFNLSPGLETVYWDKSYCWTSFLKQMKTLTDTKYVALVDNDVCFTKGWVEQCINILESQYCIKNNIKIISPWNGNPKYESVDSLYINNQSVDIRYKVGSPCWVGDIDYFLQLLFPPFNIQNAKPDDVWYWDQMNLKNHKFAVLTNNCVKDIIVPSSYSARLTYVGKDYPK